MTAPTNPEASTLPGIRNLQVQIARTIKTTGCGDFIDKTGIKRQIEYDFSGTGGGESLALKLIDGSACCFNKCPPPNQTLWYATGLWVGTPKCGIASHIYALARDLLQARGAQITPSGNLTTAGAGFWQNLDPGIRAKFKPHPGVPGDFVF